MVLTSSMNSIALSVRSTLQVVALGRASPARRPGGCRGPGPDTTGWSRRRGSRRTARSPRPSGQFRFDAARFISSWAHRCHLPTIAVLIPRSTSTSGSVAHSGGHVPVAVREAGRRLGDAGHAVGRVVAAGEQARPGRRAQRGRVPLGVAQPGRGDPVDVRRVDQPAVAAQRAESDVVQHHVDHVRRPRRGDRLGERRPVGGRVPDVEVDHPTERLGHVGSSARR